MVRATRFGVGVGVVALAAWVQGHEASACGLFWGGQITPKIAVEQVLIVFDPAAEKEHFIRELRFKNADDPFAFVVPVPAAPEVAKVDGKPFSYLHSRWGFERPDEPAMAAFDGGGSWGDGIGLGSFGGLGFGSGSGSGRGVQVVSQERVGSFTVAVLRSDDAGALGGWLKQNGFTSSKVSDQWLAGYTALNFFFAAFRYEKQGKDQGSEMKSESVRISFSTPQPYYPYREPDPPQYAPNRALRVWLVAPSPHRPVAVHDDEGLKMFKHPWEEGYRFDAPRRALDDPYLASLLPPGERFSVQAFLDTKTSRHGWGDTLLAPDTPVAYSGPQRERRRALLGAFLGAGAP